MGRPRPPGARQSRTNSAAENHQATETPARLIRLAPRGDDDLIKPRTARWKWKFPVRLGGRSAQIVRTDRTQNYFFLAPRTESLSAFAAVNRNLVRAGILIASPVAGLRPMRAL